MRTADRQAPDAGARPDRRKVSKSTVETRDPAPKLVLVPPTHNGVIGAYVGVRGHQPSVWRFLVRRGR